MIESYITTPLLPLIDTGHVFRSEFNPSPSPLRRRHTDRRVHCFSQPSKCTVPSSTRPNKIRGDYRMNDHRRRGCSGSMFRSGLAWIGIVISSPIVIYIPLFLRGWDRFRAALKIGINLALANQGKYGRGSRAYILSLHMLKTIT